MATTKELKAMITLAGKIDPSLQKTLLQAQKQVTNGGKELSKLQQLGRGAFGALKTGAKLAGAALASLTVAGIAGLAKMATTGLQVASDLAEVQNVVDVTFGQSAAKIDSWSKTLLNSYGLSELSAKKYASTLGAMMKSSGLADTQMETMSQNLTMLAGDMASFYNLDSEAAFEKIRSGLSGETEPLKQLGINMSVANLEQHRMAQGITKSYSAMSQQEQYLLRYNYLMQATADAQGDFNRTQDSFANQQKLLKENWKQMSGQVMVAALPALAKVAKGLNTMMTSMDTGKLGDFMAQMADMVAGLMPLGQQLLPKIMDMVTGLVPPLMDIVQAVMPPLTQLMLTVVDTMAPLVQKIMPPIARLLQTILPPLVKLINLVLPPLTQFLSFVVDIASVILDVAGTLAGGFIDGLVGLFDGSGTSIATGSTGGVPSSAGFYANGGFANRASIFGEAGLEAAIPIRPGNRRSIQLLERTANLLGVGMGGTNINYAPVINGGNADELQPVLRQGLADLEAMLDRRDNLRRRMSFCPA